MQPIVKRSAAIGVATLTLALVAVVAGIVTPTRQVQAQPSSAMFSQKPPEVCACAAPVPLFGAAGSVIVHCQCGALSCAAATAAGGVTLHCGR